MYLNKLLLKYKIFINLRGARSTIYLECLTQSKNYFKLFNNNLLKYIILGKFEMRLFNLIVINF